MNEQSMGANSPRLKSVSDLFKVSWAQFKEHFNVLAPIMLISGVGLILQSLIMLGPQGGNEGVLSLLALLATLIYIAGSIWGSVALYNRIMKMEQPMTVGQAFTAAKPYIWPMILVGILTALATLIGFILLIIPGIIVGVWVSFAYFLIIDENKRGVEALKASKAYVEGFWWAVFGRYLALGIVLIVLFAIAGALIFALLGQSMGNLIINVLSLLITPFVVLYQYDIYKNLKQIKGGSTSMPSAVASSPAGNT